VIVDVPDPLAPSENEAGLAEIEKPAPAAAGLICTATSNVWESVALVAVTWYVKGPSEAVPLGVNVRVDGAVPPARRVGDGGENVVPTPAGDDGPDHVPVSPTLPLKPFCEATVHVIGPLVVPCVTVTDDGTHRMMKSGVPAPPAVVTVTPTSNMWESAPLVAVRWYVKGPSEAVPLAVNVMVVAPSGGRCTGLAENLVVTPDGDGAHVSVSATSPLKPFCEVIVHKIGAPGPPCVTVTDDGVQEKRKSGVTAPPGPETVTPTSNVWASAPLVAVTWSVKVPGEAVPLVANVRVDVPAVAGVGVTGLGTNVVVIPVGDAPCHEPVSVTGELKPFCEVTVHMLGTPPGTVTGDVQERKKSGVPAPPGAVTVTPTSNVWTSAPLVALRRYVKGPSEAVPIAVNVTVRLAAGLIGTCTGLAERLVVTPVGDGAHHSSVSATSPLKPFCEVTVHKIGAPGPPCVTVTDDGVQEKRKSGVTAPPGPETVTVTSTDRASAAATLVPVTWYVKVPSEAVPVAAIVRVVVAAPLAGGVATRGENVVVTPVGDAPDHEPASVTGASKPLKPFTEVTVHMLGDLIPPCGTVNPDDGSQWMLKSGSGAL
jgi:hypothetical protein